MAVSQISTLTTALKAAGLDDEAASAGPFTVFAPTTIQGEKLTVSTAGGKVTVNGANVIQADVMSNNGVAHVIDQVLMPAGK